MNTTLASDRGPIKEIKIGGIRLTYIPPGQFWMGSPESDTDAYEKEMPQHLVRIIKGFYLGIFPVTQEEFENVMGKNISDCKSHRCPVESVNRFSALSFCQAFSEQIKCPVRLPTEAEWEYACRAGATTRYFFGDNNSRLDDYAWYKSNSANQIHPVGQKKPNAWGLFDMLGNVWEWCIDWYQKDFYADGPVENPCALAPARRGVVRGGSFFNEPHQLRCASRGLTFPEVGRSRYGLRICIESYSQSQEAMV